MQSNVKRSRKMYSDTNFNISVNLKKYHIFTLQFAMEAFESFDVFFLFYYKYVHATIVGTVSDTGSIWHQG